jgi:hypothetical protein
VSTRAADPTTNPHESFLLEVVSSRTCHSKRHDWQSPKRLRVYLLFSRWAVPETQVLQRISR